MCKLSSYFPSCSFNFEIICHVIMITFFLDERVAIFMYSGDLIEHFLVHSMLFIDLLYFQAILKNTKMSDKYA